MCVCLRALGQVFISLWTEGGEERTSSLRIRLVAGNDWAGAGNGRARTSATQFRSFDVGANSNPMQKVLALWNFQIIVLHCDEISSTRVAVS